MSHFTPHVPSPARFAVFLLWFSDLPPLSIGKRAFKYFIGGGTRKPFEYISGRGVSDYWKDISYGRMSIGGSDIYGPYTMQYSYVKDGNRRRETWIGEAVRLAKENNIDLSPYYGILAIINSNPDDSQEGPSLALGISEWGQNNWRWCSRCQGLAFAGTGSPGPCPAGEWHDHSRSLDYTLAMNMPAFPGQKNWRLCRKCQGLAYGGSPGSCQAGGQHDFNGSADYTLAVGSVDFQGQDQWKWCRKCQGLAYAGTAASSACPAGGSHDHMGSGNYTLAAPVYDWYYKTHFNLTFAAHEMGHCFGLSHAKCAGDTVRDYCDPWDVMGSGIGTYSSGTTPFSPVGPGLNAGNLARLGWIPEDRIHTAKSGSEVVQLAALSEPTAAGHLMARIITSDKIYTVEYRQRTRWDRGLPGDAVVIHELRSPYTLGQNNWRWCSRCMGLAYAGFGPGACPAGGVHDHSRSSNYSLISGIKGFAGQNNWKWCRKCQALAYAGAGAGRCPAGGVHDQTTSLDYTLVSGSSEFAGQNSWRWCQKCQALAYGGGAAGRCPAGGNHDHSRSADYTLFNFEAAEPFLLASRKTGERWVDFDRQVSVLVDRLDPTSFTARVDILGV